MGLIVALCDMRPVEKPIIIPGTAMRPGCSIVQAIEESHIAIHAFPQEQRVYIDVFSCKPFDEENVIKLIDEAFCWQHHHRRIIRFPARGELSPSPTPTTT